MHAQKSDCTLIWGKVSVPSTTYYIKLTVKFLARFSRETNTVWSAKYYSVVLATQISLSSQFVARFPPKTNTSRFYCSENQNAHCFTQGKKKHLRYSIGFVESASGLHSDKRTKESLVIKQPRKSSSAS